jgi:flagellar biosynthesis/type III secretory pathway chaperone
MERLDSLCAVLGDETEVCGALSAVLRREQEAVIALRPDALLACLQERQVLAEELEQLATQRRALVSAVARERGNDAASAGTLLANLPPDLQPALRTRLRELRHALLETRGLERQNARLAGASQESVTEILCALRTVTPGARYGANAEVAVPRARDLVDRRV